MGPQLRNSGTCKTLISLLKCYRDVSGCASLGVGRMRPSFLKLRSSKWTFQLRPSFLIGSFLNGEGGVCCYTEHLLLYRVFAAIQSICCCTGHLLLYRAFAAAQGICCCVGYYHKIRFGGGGAIVIAIAIAIVIVIVIIILNSSNKQ